MNHLTRVHQQRLTSLRSHTAAVLTTAWNQLGFYDSAAADRFVPTAARVVTAAQRVAATQTRAYVQTVLGQQPPPLDLTQINPTTIRNGTPVTQVYRRPFETVWWRLSEGDSPAAAIDQGRQRLDMTAQTDVQLAVRAAGTLMGAVAGQTVIRGWQRVADDGACDICAAADGEQLEPGDDWGLHPFCGCTAMPLADDPNLSDNGADPNYVTTHDHSELGALLYAAGDSFSEV